MEPLNPGYFTDYFRADSVFKESQFSSAVVLSWHCPLDLNEILNSQGSADGT